MLKIETRKGAGFVPAPCATAMASAKTWSAKTLAVGLVPLNGRDRLPDARHMIRVSLSRPPVYGRQNPLGAVLQIPKTLTPVSVPTYTWPLVAGLPLRFLVKVGTTLLASEFSCWPRLTD
jgi:hypothetical protein